MIKKIRQIMKNQKGLTLVELLAVVVILGIIAAIAVPSIGGIIDNSKKDAHVSNAEMMVSAARLALAANDLGIDTNAAANIYKFELEDLVANGYLEEVIDPDSDTKSKYPDENSYVQVEESSTPTNAKKFTYKVVLKGVERGIDQVKDTTAKLERKAVKITHAVSVD